MTIDEFVKLTEAATKLLGVLAWPAVALFVLVQFGASLRDFLAGVAEFTFKGGGFEATAKRRQAEAAAALAAAEASRPEEADSTKRDARAAAGIVAEVAPPRVIRRASGSRVLWVDDRPKNNMYERQAMEALGISFELAPDTDEALNKLRNQRFDAIISDMGRPPDGQAGYTLLDSLRKGGDQTPFIIYASSRSAEDRAESRRRGAVGCTNRPDELLEMVLRVLGHGAYL